jgi:hypothetical protein
MKAILFAFLTFSTFSSAYALNHCVINQPWFPKGVINFYDITFNQGDSVDVFYGDNTGSSSGSRYHFEFTKFSPDFRKAYYDTADKSVTLIRSFTSDENKSQITIQEKSRWSDAFQANVPYAILPNAECSQGQTTIIQPIKAD